MRWSTRSVFAAAAIAAAATPASAQVPAGDYIGTIHDRGQPVPVVLRIGPTTGSIRFNEPWACSLSLAYSSRSDQEVTYALMGAGGGRCMMLMQGNLRVKPSGGTVQAELFRRDGSSLGRVALRRQ